MIPSPSSKRSADSAPDGAPLPKRGSLWAICRRLDDLKINECNLLKALVQVLCDQGANPANLFRLSSSPQDFLGDHEGSLRSVLPTLHDLDAAELGTLSLLVKDRIRHGERGSTHPVQGTSGQTQAGPGPPDRRKSSPSRTSVRRSVPGDSVPKPTPVNQQNEVISVSCIPPKPTQSEDAVRPRVPSTVERAPPTSKKCAACYQFKTHNTNCVRFLCKQSCKTRILVGSGAEKGKHKTKFPHCAKSTSAGYVRYRNAFHQHVQSRGCKAARGEIYKTFRERATLEELEWADGGTFLNEEKGRDYWKCSKCGSENIPVGVWSHIFYRCKHRESFLDVEDEVVMSCDEADV